MKYATHKAKAIIKTPIGQAKKAEPNLRRLIKGFHRYKSFETYVNDEDSMLIMEVEGSLKDIMHLNKKLAQFDYILKGIFNKKLVKNAIDRYMPEQKEELESMLQGQTKLELIKEDVANKKEANNKTFWENLKEKMKKL
jgi:hypothetical protein